jgi:hypothetical protein
VIAKMEDDESTASRSISKLDILAGDGEGGGHLLVANL